MDTKSKSRILARRTKHLKELKALGYTRDSLKPLEVIEREAHKAAEDSCNGDIDNDQWSEIDIRLSARVAALFGGEVPLGFYINGDARGYALKLDHDAWSEHPLAAPGRIIDPISYTDWGGYMILAPDFEETEIG